MAFVYSGAKVDLGFGRGWLDRPGAESIWRIDRQIGHALQITEAGRTWEQQMRHWLNYQRNGYPIALHPDTPSLHQKGNAVDSNEAQRIQRIMEDNGWRRTVYRWVNGVWTLVEPWHYEYFAHLDKYRNTGSAAGGATPLEDDMTPEQDALLRNIAAHLYLGGVSAKDPNYLGGEGTVYNLLKTPVYRGDQKIPQIQDNADTNTMVREILSNTGDINRGTETGFVNLNQEVADSKTMLLALVPLIQGLVEKIDSIEAKLAEQPGEVEPPKA